MIAASALLLLAATAPSLAGFYHTDQMEMAGELELRGDGRFRYQLDYGAVAEAGQGYWTADAQGIKLTSDPMPREPRFLLIRDDPAPSGELKLDLVEPVSGWGGQFDAIVTLQGSAERIRVPLTETGQVDLPPGAKVTAVQILAPIRATPSDPVALDPAQGHHLYYRFEPNDFGLAVFRGENLRLKDSVLEMFRHGVLIRFERVPR